MSMKQEPDCDIIDSQIYKFPGRSKSFVWNHFGFQKGPDGELDKSRAVCKICRHGIRYSGNTTNLHCHLTKHRRQNATIFNGIDFSFGQESPDTQFDFKFVDSLVQSTVEDSKSGNNLSSSDDTKTSQRSKHQQLNDTIINFFIEHLLPLSVVESTSFYSMIAVADPMYVVPDKETLIGTLIQQTFNETKKSIEMQLSGNEVVTLAEVWESITGEKFVSISSQLITALWQRKTFLLKTVSMNEIPNESAFLNLLKTTYNEWGIKNSTVLMNRVNEDSKIIQKAISSLHLVNMACCSQVLYTAGDNIMKNLPMTKSVIENVIMLIGRILQNKSPQEIYTKLFEIIKDYKEIEAKSFPWTSFTSVLQCALENEELTRKQVLMPETLTDETWKQMNDLKSVLSPLLKARVLLCDKTNIVSSSILPVLRKLEVTFSWKEEDSEFTKVLKQVTWATVSEPFCANKTVNNFLLISSLLDPRYKDLQFVETSKRTHARNILTTVATEMFNEIDRENGGTYDGEIIVVEESGDVIRIEPMEKRQKLKRDEGTDEKDDWLADVICNEKQNEKTVEKSEKVMVEIDHYIATPQVSTSPLQWWSSREGLYPVLSRLARRYLCMNNDCIGENKTVRNANLSNDTIDKLLVLHHHYYCQ